MNNKKRILAHGTALLPMLRKKSTPVERFPDEPLTVESVDRIARRYFPAYSRGEDSEENFSEFLRERWWNISTTRQLIDAIESHLGTVLVYDRYMSRGYKLTPSGRRRAEAGGFFIHIGLLRNVCQCNADPVAYRRNKAFGS